MRRITIYLTTAFLTFGFGWAGSLAVGKITSAIDTLVSTPDPVSAISPLPFFLDKEHEYEDEIYSVTIHRLYIGHHKKLVIVESPTSAYESVACENAEDSATGCNIVSEIEKETLENYVDKNRNSDHVHITNLGLEYQFITAQESFEIFSNYGAGGWETFYERFPDSTGIIRFSRIGFNERHDQAFLYVENTCGSLCGSGSFVLLDRHGDDWQVVKETPVWES